MISSIDYLDIDVSNLLGKYIYQYIETKKKNKRVLNELKDNILFTTHINYYKKNFQSSRGPDSYTRSFIESKHKTLTNIKKIMHLSGWIVNYPTKFIWHPPYPDCELDYDERKVKNIELKNKNLRMVEKLTNWKYVSYPPHIRHYNSRDLIKNIKIK
jgi:hypothetical protein